MHSIVRGAALVFAVVAAALTAGFLWVLWSGQALDTGTGGPLNLVVEAGGTEAAKMTVTVIAAAVVLLPALLLLIAWPREQRLISVDAAGMQALQVPAKALERHVEASLKDVEHVQGVEAHIQQAKDRDVALNLNLQVDADADAGSVVSVVEERVASALASPYGITTRRKPNISIRHTNRRGKTPKAPEQPEQKVA